MKLWLGIFLIVMIAEARAEPFDVFVMNSIPVCPAAVKPVFPPSWVVWGAIPLQDGERREQWIKHLKPIIHAPCKIVAPDYIAVCGKFYCRKG